VTESAAGHHGHPPTLSPFAPQSLLFAVRRARSHRSCSSRIATPHVSSSTCGSRGALSRSSGVSRTSRGSSQTAGSRDRQSLRGCGGPAHRCSELTSVLGLWALRFASAPFFGGLIRFSEGLCPFAPARSRALPERRASSPGALRGPGFAFTVSRGSDPSVNAARPAEERLGIRSRRTSRRRGGPNNGENP
jgi:hypothetical protein